MDLFNVREGCIKRIELRDDDVELLERERG